MTDRCKTFLTRNTARYICINPQHHKNKDWGYILVSSCPTSLYKSSQLVRACVHPDPSDIFQQVPVFDRKSNKSYRNYFCAKCNLVVNVTYWESRLPCKHSLINPTVEFNLTDYKEHYCKEPWIFSPPRNSSNERCLVRRHTGWYGRGNSNQKTDWKIVKDLCKAYYLPVCKKDPFLLFGQSYNNPHCFLRFVSFRTLIDLHCHYCPEGRLPRKKGLQILFDFSSTSQLRIVVGSQKEIVVKAERCSRHQVYDPFRRSCRDALALQDTFLLTKMNAPLSNLTSNSLDTELRFCVGVLFKANKFTLLPNGSVYIIPHKRLYPKSIYSWNNNSTIILCTNFSRNYTVNITTILRTAEEHSSIFSFITYIGSTFSAFSLIILIALYVYIKETKKLPGKITISLSGTLLVFQVLFFFAGFTDKPALCTAMAVVLHYLLLSFFTWMNVLAANMGYSFATMGRFSSTNISFLPVHSQVRELIFF